ncbi:MULTISPECIES: DUF819 domain-containing protein [unclassified Imperialibacter]|uniref:DUF819 family protein n=1 Tax=unclassified Imperialibacter TaxID=2629706 RepID=UPI001252F391|nr:MULTISPECIES: DUF819 family protein [unclassified Imperialibacter]CAD5277715.1 putative integral membrane protein [Imperialibacter sp. 89]CAD5292035.1 putative integral membrane protein [Imperialibacter sp. 75]VVT00215.1 putative integral membrane protein [Imperialibacter sp. EC-SDR9]
MEETTAPLITNDAVVFGILIVILAAVFGTASSKHTGWQKFYSIVPTVLLCYFIPSILNSMGIISGAHSKLYFVASRYLLPASLVLLTVSVDLKEIMKLGPKALIMFFAGTVGIMLGGPLAILLFSVVAPEVVTGTPGQEVWRGMTAIAGSWIGGGANQTAMREVFGVGGEMFSTMVTVDILIGNLWLAFLLYGTGRAEKIDKFLKSDTSAIEEVKKKIETYRLSIMRVPNMSDTLMILAVGFGVTGLSHFGADIIAPWIGENFPGLEEYSLTSGFFWIVVIATTLGLLLSFTKARNLEGAGASRLGSVFLYILVATIGMEMNLLAIFENPGLFLVGFVWILFHITIMLVVAKLIKAPFFFVAVGSQANVGGAASAPIVASAFNPSLAPVGVLLAVLGYAAGTYGAYLCGLMMQAVAP